MDSSLKNPPSAPLSPPLLPPPFSHQFHSEWLDYNDRSRQIYRHHHQDFHKHMHRQDFPWESAVNEPPSYYFQPSLVLYESPWISQPSYNFSCTEPRDFSVSAWNGYMERRFDAGLDRNFQLDYGYRGRDCSDGFFNRDWDSNFRSRDGFRGYARNDSRDVRIEESYRDCGQFYSDSDRYCRWPGTSFAYGNFPYGDWGTGNQRWVEEPKDDCYHSGIERHFYNGKRKGSDKSNRRSKKLRQNESLLLLGTPRPHQKRRENHRSRLPPHFSEKRFKSSRGKNHSDCGTVEKQTANGNETNCIGVNSSVETVSRNESKGTTPLNSTTEVDYSLGRDAGKYIINISQSCEDVAGMGSSSVQPEERTFVSLLNICKNKEGWSDGSVLDRELSSAMYLEDVSLAPNEDLGLSTHDSADILSVDHSCDLSCRGMETCLTESNVSLCEEINVGASEFHLKQGVREDASTCDQFSSSPVSEIETSLIGNIGSSCSKTVTDPETKPSSAGCELLPNDHFGFGASDVEGSFWMSSVDKDLVDDPSRISSCLVPDSSVSLCHHSPSLSVNEQIRKNLASSAEANCSSHCGIIEKGMERAENMDVDIQEQKIRLSGETSQCETSDTDFVTVSGDSMLQSGFSSILPRLITGQIQNETHAATKVEKTNNSRELNKEEILLAVSQEQIEKLTDGVLVEKPFGELIEKLTDVPPDRGSQEITLSNANTDVHVGEALSFGGKVPGIESPSNSNVLLSKLHSKPPSDRTSSGKCALSPGMDLLANGLRGSSSGEADDPAFVQNGLESSDTLVQTGYCQPKQNPPKLESSKMLYVKRKANQLVAASDIHGASKSEISPSSVYFKRSKNQLFRNSKSLANHGNFLIDAALDSQTGGKMVPKRFSSSALSESAVVRPFNQSKCSLVWRLREPLSIKANGVPIIPQKIVQKPIPWKRETYCRRVMNPTSVLRNSSFSTIRKFRLQSKIADNEKERSSNGYSLKNSIEKDSKKSEFLSDVDSSRSGPPESGKDTEKSSIPIRMVMGNDKSVWIRNVNQLVRDPKKRARVLTNEKVRWSVHNAQFRLAKGKNYCQFFTRFGKCNKDDGKCPYLHDPSKIAVCTKFLSGLCTNPDCKLTHKVVPESMSDCNYFLQGLCNKESCPFRHVHVHQNAAICEGFLKGYCSDGNECRKKHTYTCQVFEATGSCPQGSECKLHHPKNRSKGKKRKRASEPCQQNPRGRYFGSMHNLLEPEPMLVNELAIIDGAVFGEEGSDFIRLDVNEKEARENTDPSNTESVSEDSEDQNSTDELIRPVRLMQK